jgi:hypothetical protein
VDVFSEVVKIIKTPNLKKDPMDNGVKGRHCKFFHEAAESSFHKALGPKYPAYISNFNKIISCNFLFFSGINKNKENKTLGLPDDLWTEIANYLKLGDVSWDHAKPGTSSGLLGSNDNAESEC